MISTLLVLLTLRGAFAHARVDESPVFAEVRMFRGAHNPKHTIIVGIARDAEKEHAYVTEFIRGERRDLGTIDIDRNAFPGRDVVIEFADGRWLMGPVNSLRSRATDDSIPAGLIDPVHGREPLVEVEVTRHILKELDLSERMTPEGLRQVQERDVLGFHDWRDARDKEVAFLAFDTKTPEAVLNPPLPTVRTFTRLTSDGTSFVSMWVLEDQVVHVRQMLRARGQQKIAFALTITDLPGLTRHRELFEAVERKLSNQANPGMRQLDALSVQTAEALNALSLTRTDHANVLMDLKRYSFSGPAREALRTKFIEPIDQLVNYGYEVLHRLNTPRSRDLLVMSAGSVGPRFEYLDRVSDASGATYFTRWVDHLRHRLTWVHRADPKAVEARLNKTPLITKFDFLNAHLFEFATHEETLATIPTYPLRTLGLRDSAARREMIVRLILEGDKAAAYAGEHFNPSDNDGARTHFGSYALARVLAALASGADDHHRDPGTSKIKFSRALYLTQAAKIVTELLETAPVAIVNSATLISVLDAALLLQDQIKGDVEAGQTSPDLIKALLNLMSAVNVRAMRLAFSPNVTNCELDLL